MQPADRNDNADRTGTRDAILDAAEELFATNGYVATSLRQLTRAAGVNLAAVHYHFGSKEGLLSALFERRLGPLNEERLRRLSDAETAAAPDAAPVEVIMRAFVAPPIEAGMGADCATVHFIKLVGRSHAQESAEMGRIFHQQFAALIDRFGDALRRALPHLPPEEIHWRMHFCAGAFSHTLMNRDKVRWASGGLCDPDDPTGVTDRLVAFLTAGMVGTDQASPAKTKTKKKSKSKTKTTPKRRAGKKSARSRARS